MAVSSLSMTLAPSSSSSSNRVSLIALYVNFIQYKYMYVNLIYNYIQCFSIFSSMCPIHTVELGLLQFFHKTLSHVQETQLMMKTVRLPLYISSLFLLPTNPFTYPISKHSSSILLLVFYEWQGIWLYVFDVIMISWRIYFITNSSSLVNSEIRAINLM